MQPEIAKALNLQINNELRAWYTYLAMSAHFDAMHLDGFAKFMESQSREEQEHAHRLFRFVLDRGGQVELQALSPPEHKLGTIADVFARAVEQERANTKAIYDLYDIAKKLSDYATVATLQWFLDEQVEEEKVMVQALGLVKFAGEDKSALLALNRDFGQREKTPEPEG